MQKFSEQLVEARKARGMTQEALARALEVTRQTVSSWERGRTLPDVEMGQAISKVLDWDFSQTGEPPEPPEEAKIEALPVAEAPAEAPPAEEAKIEPLPVAEAPAEAPPAEEVPAGKRRKRWLWVAAAVAVVVCVGLALSLRAAHRPADGDAFPADHYRQQTENDPARPFLIFNNVRWTEQGDTQTNDYYAFKMLEQNGHAFDVTSVEGCAEGKSGVLRTFSLGASDLVAMSLDPAIKPYGELTIDGGWPQGEFLRIGMEVRGQDPDGQTLVFYSLIEF